MAQPCSAYQKARCRLLSRSFKTGELQRWKCRLLFRCPKAFDRKDPFLNGCRNPSHQTRVIKHPHRGHSLAGLGQQLQTDLDFKYIFSAKVSGKHTSCLSILLLLTGIFKCQDIVPFPGSHPDTI